MPSSSFRRAVRRQLSLNQLEYRTAPAVTNFGGDAQHTGISGWMSQPVQAIHWQATVDVDFNGSFGHYGAPLVTNANTILLPTKLGPASAPNFHVRAVNGNDGTEIWDLPGGWIPQNVSWYPPYQPAYSTATNRVYFAGPGGTIFYRTNPDSPTGTVTQLAYFGMGNYTPNQAGYNANVAVDTPLTVDTAGSVYFGVRVLGSGYAGLTSGIVRIAPNDTTTWISARTASNNDPSIDDPARNSAMALSNDGATLYVGVRNRSSDYYGRLLALNAATLATQFVSDVLRDPRNGNPAALLDESTASPMVGPDGRVFYGVVGNPNGGYRGWMLQFSSNLLTQYTPGGFGWDTTPSLIPRSMVPQYTGTAPYLIFTKYNNYYYGDGDGSNKIAILDPFDTEVDTHASAGGQLIMKTVLTKVGPTHDSNYPNVPTAVREWCVNHAAVDPATNCVLVNSEDGKVYRWHLPSDTLTESITLTPAFGQPYTPTVIAADGTLFAIADGILFGLGKTPGLTAGDAAVASPSTNAVVTVSLDFPRTTPITVHYATANGTAVAGVNYTATSGDLTFSPGEKSKTINVSVNPGSVSGASAAFFVNLTTPGGAVLADAQAQVTLLGRPPRVQAVTVNGGAQQRSRVTSLTVAFDQIVNLPNPPASAFQLIRPSDGETVTLAATVNNSGPGTVATLTFIGGAAVQGDSLADGRYTLTVAASAVSNAAGQLDGNADGADGDNYTLVGSPTAEPKLFRLFGDINGDGFTDNVDLLLFRRANGSDSTMINWNPAFDFDGDGFIDNEDLVEFRQRLGVPV